MVDPDLTGYACVIFDEFHERSVEADVSLALCRDVQNHLRPELRLLVMSATLGGELSERLAVDMDATVVASEGRQYDVDIRYLSLVPGPVSALVRSKRRDLVDMIGSATAYAIEKERGQ